MANVVNYFPFPVLRPHQAEFLEAIVQAFDSGYKYVPLEAPTGFGKSPLAVALGNYYGDQGNGTHILTSTKQLQTQYLSTFPNDVRTVKGRANFTCNAVNVLIDQAKVPTSRAPCITDPKYDCSLKPGLAGEDLAAISANRGPLFWKSKEHCTYWAQKTGAMNSKIALHNYPYFIGETEHVGDFGKRDLLICDEAHNIESEIMKYVGLKVDARTLKQCGLRIEGDVEEAVRYRTVLDTLADNLRQLVDIEVDPERANELEQLLGKTQMVADGIDCNPKNWVVLHTNGGIEFKPLQISNYTKDLLFNKGERVLLMSATILNINMLQRYLGLDPREVAPILKVPAQISPDQRKFHLRYVGSMSRESRTETMPRLIEEVDKIITEHPHEKGIIHSVSYQNAKEIYSGVSSHSRSRLLFPTSSQQIPRNMEIHTTSSDPTVLLSPSMKEGVDLVEALSRFQVMVKVPYPFLGDPQIMRRMKNDRSWYEWMTLVSLIQTAGRSVRSTEDWAETFILDSAFDNLKNSRLIPKWFKEAYVSG